MQFDQISATIRSRTPWEGVDLGFALARQWFWPLWRLWWCTALPVTLLALLILHKWPLAAAMVVWWLKPLYEPMLLFWLSRRLFGDELTVRETLGEWRSTVSPRLFANLTLRRFSPNRSFYMPVSHLEGLRGEARNKRLQVLAGDGTAGFWLTVIGAHFEMILCYSLLLLLFYLIPDELLPDSLWQLFKEGNSMLLWLSNAFWLLAISLFAPFYVAGGFALYITRRSQLEAWDLELTFRRIAPRLKTAQAGAALLLVCGLVLGITTPSQQAIAAEGSTPTHEESRQLIKQVLADEVFGKKQSEKYWKYLGKQDEKKREPRNWNLEWLPTLAKILELLLWLGVAALLGWLLLYLTRFLRLRTPQKRVQPVAPPTVLFGMPVTPDSLPEDIGAAIHALLDEQHYRAALSLLYRATLVQLIHDHQLRIPDSATEGECQRIVTAQRPTEEAGYFTRLTRTWVWCAYGDTAPSNDDLTRLLSDWQRLYGAAGHA